MTRDLENVFLLNRHEFGVPCDLSLLRVIVLSARVGSDPTGTGHPMN